MIPSQISGLLDLRPLPAEGGFYSETYRSGIVLGVGGKSCGTCIYYFLQGNDRSAWHRLKSDEIWFYHAGSAAIQLLLFPDGRFEERHIGVNFECKERPQGIIPAGTWQTTFLKGGYHDSWGLFSTVVCPGFEFSDYEAGKSEDLVKEWPAARKKMEAFGML